MLVIGAGEMGEEALRYLMDEGAARFRSSIAASRGPRSWPSAWPASRGRGRSCIELLVEADLVVSATGSTEPIMTVADFRSIVAERYQRPLLILDLAIPRDFDPAIGELTGVYLYSIDDLKAACEKNRRERETGMAASRADHRGGNAAVHGRSASPGHRPDDQAPQVAGRRSQGRRAGPAAEQARPRRCKDAEPKSPPRFDRLVNKLLHPPLESLRDEAEQGTPHGLLEASRRLFRLNE